MADREAAVLDIPELKSLRRVFGNALWGPKFYSAWQACSEIRAAKTANQKSKIIDARFGDWKVGSVSAIRE